MTQDAINLQTLNFLLSAEGQDAAQELMASSADFSPARNAQRLLAHLRKQYSPQDAGALLSLVRLRQAAADKFPDAARLYFTQDALEQATAWPIAQYRAARIDALAPSGPILDLGSGIGGDALALGQVRTVHAYERDPLRFELLRANVRAVGLEQRITVHGEDWQAGLAMGRLPSAAAAFWDPPRRAGGRRLMRLGQILPSWQPIRELRGHTPLVCLKLMPGIDDAEIPTDATVEFVSHASVCKEAMLWLGDSRAQRAQRAPVLHSGIQPIRQAAVHDGAQWHALRAGGGPPPLGELAAGQILYEPDPAVIRAGAFAELCGLLKAHLFDPQIAYLVADPRPAGRDEEGRTPVATPFATAFWIDEVHPYALKTLNARLQARGIGVVELKKRGAPFEPESLRPRLKLTAGGAAAVVFFTRQGNRRLMLIGRRAGSP